MTDIDRCDSKGNLTQHRLHPTRPDFTRCGVKICKGMTQDPAGNRKCRNCYPANQETAP